jgi:hypothetical protein
MCLIPRSVIRWANGPMGRIRVRRPGHFLGAAGGVQVGSRRLRRTAFSPWRTSPKLSMRSSHVVHVIDPFLPEIPEVSRREVQSAQAERSLPTFQVLPFSPIRGPVPAVDSRQRSCQAAARRPYWLAWEEGTPGRPHAVECRGRASRMPGFRFHPLGDPVILTARRRPLSLLSRGPSDPPRVASAGRASETRGDVSRAEFRRGTNSEKKRTAVSEAAAFCRLGD